MHSQPGHNGSGGLSGTAGPPLLLLTALERHTAPLSWLGSPRPQAEGTSKGLQKGSCPALSFPPSMALSSPFLFSFLSFFGFLGLHLWQRMNIPRLGVELELQPPAYTTATATATPLPSHICNLHYGSQQCWILNPLSEARE